MAAPANEVYHLTLEIQSAKTMLSSIQEGSAAKEAYVQSVMMHLVEFAESEPTQACCLMTALWPIADELFMHDICDSVDLWIVNNQSPELLDYLNNLSATESDADLKRHWDDLISNFV